MNILWSHDERGFLDGVRGFVDQVGEVEFIDLFLSSLKEPVWGEGRVSVVCEAILKVLLTNYAQSHSHCILTAHLSKIPPDIPAALSMIAQLKGPPSKDGSDCR
jgi:elongator complex protein 1